MFKSLGPGWTTLVVFTALITGGFWNSAAAHELHLSNGAVVDYTDWKNMDNKGCCDGKHCRPVPKGFQRSIGGRLHVFVEGEGVAKGQSAWCPVLARHLLKTGVSPNSSVAHYCIWDAAGKTPCEQFLCYEPPNGFFSLRSPLGAFFL